MAQSISRRGRGAPGRARWLALLGVTGVALVLTFAVGVLVGRQWVRHPQPAHSSGEPVKKPAVTARRSGLTEPIERPAPQEKLTFYQTLTAPLSAPPAPAKVDGAARPQGPATLAGPAAPDRAAGSIAAGPARDDKPAAEHGGTGPSAARAERPSAERVTAIRTSADARADWVVQVGAFKDRNQAEHMRRPLAAAGFDVYVLAVPDGADVRYKVRLGGFRTRDEAARVAQRLKQERSVAAFVAPR